VVKVSWIGSFVCFANAFVLNKRKTLDFSAFIIIFGSVLWFGGLVFLSQPGAAANDHYQNT
jgi:hypothetical protein